MFTAALWLFVVADDSHGGTLKRTPSPNQSEQQVGFVTLSHVTWCCNNLIDFNRNQFDWYRGVKKSSKTVCNVNVLQWSATFTAVESRSASSSISTSPGSKPTPANFEFRPIVADPVRLILTVVYLCFWFISNLHWSFGMHKMQLLLFWFELHYGLCLWLGAEDCSADASSHFTRSST